MAYNGLVQALVTR